MFRTIADADSHQRRILFVNGALHLFAKSETRPTMSTHKRELEHSVWNNRSLRAIQSPVVRPRTILEWVSVPVRGWVIMIDVFHGTTWRYDGAWREMGRFPWNGQYSAFFHCAASCSGDYVVVLAESQREIWVLDLRGSDEPEWKWAASAYVSGVHWPDKTSHRVNQVIAGVCCERIESFMDWMFENTEFPRVVQELVLSFLVFDERVHIITVHGQHFVVDLSRVIAQNA